MRLFGHDRFLRVLLENVNPCLCPEARENLTYEEHLGADPDSVGQVASVASYLTGLSLISRKGYCYQHCTGKYNQTAT